MRRAFDMGSRIHSWLLPACRQFCRPRRNRVPSDFLAFGGLLNLAESKILPPASVGSSRSLYPHEHDLFKLEVRPLELSVSRDMAGGSSPARMANGAMTALLDDPARDLVSDILKHPPCLRQDPFGILSIPD